MKFLRKLLLLFGIAYVFRRHIFAWLLKLPPVQHRVIVSRNIRIPMPDGVTLIADHYSPAVPGDYPTILIRSPYGRNFSSSSFGLQMAFFARRFAERGYHVIVQDVRGRMDSGGEFDPYFNERGDGLATLAWLEAQSWFNGKAGTWGPSYLGIVQWVIADAPQVQALVPVITGSDLSSIIFPDGAFDLALAMRWMRVFYQLDRQRGRWWWNILSYWSDVERAIKPAFAHLPLRESDRIAVGRTVDYYQLWMEHPSADDEYWEEYLNHFDINSVEAPVHLVGGWYDFFLRAMLKDYGALKAAGRTPYLTIGPWHHFNAMASGHDLREGIHWFEAFLKNNHARLRRNPVRIYIMGAGEWREMPDFPPPATETAYYLQPMGWLSQQPSQVESLCDHYVYNPVDPTPYVGGAQFHPFAGMQDNRALEARPDVLTYTTSLLEHDIEVIGAVNAILYVRSSLDYTDFFTRLCDVYPDGRSMNICDGLTRIEPGNVDHLPDGSIRVSVDMWFTAYRFKAGHAFRLQVSSGAHPRWCRNPGTGKPINTATSLQVADQTIYFGRAHPSALMLPVNT